MKALLDFLPIVAFFIAYKTSGVLVAAITLMIAVGIIYGAIWLKTRKLETGQWITVGATFILGGLTVALNNEAFLQWKAPGVYVLLALIFLGSQYIGHKPLAEHMMGAALNLNDAQWQKLNFSWVAFFLISAVANAYIVVYHPEFWVDFKLFGSLAMTFIFIILQGIWLVRIGAIKETKQPNE
ncbi:MAG: septation protein IspZ [Moraxellaceae bacterium]|nr:septation protein IspZ [Moraxellaceae bacterium]MDZ4387196.1 septation protein IspZ [Moraxellaceae bacterium]